jgi:hypothetical protein
MDDFFSGPRQARRHRTPRPQGHTGRSYPAGPTDFDGFFAGPRAAR